MNMNLKEENSNEEIDIDENKDVLILEIIIL